MSVKTAQKQEAALRTKAATLAAKTADAYSAERYGLAEWLRCTTFLLDLGLSARDAETVLRSKVMRWAADEFVSKWDDDRDYPTVDCLVECMAKWNRPFHGLGVRSKAALRHA